MKYNKLTPFKWCIINNFPFIEADFDAITNYQLFQKIVEYLNKTINTTNTLGLEVEELNNWFNNLDVQDEVNKKLDEMAESGELERIIAKYISKSNVKLVIPGITHQGDFCAFQFKKENIIKNIIIDFGTIEEYENYCNKLLINGITKIDYAFISHYHKDHIGCLTSFINDNRFDFSNCVFYLPLTPDYSRFVGSVRYIPEEETRIIRELTEKGYKIIHPTNETLLEIDIDLKINFLNCNYQDFENYYNVTSYYEELGMNATNYNNFSMVLVIKHLNNKLLFTGDIEKEAEDVIISQGLQICDFVKIPHHDVNLYSRTSENFWKNFYLPKIATIISTSSDGFMYRVSKNLEIYNTRNNNNIEVFSNGYSLRAISNNGRENIDVPFGFAMQAQNISQFIDISGGLNYSNILENQDMNDFIIPGTFRSLGAEITNSLENAPFKDNAFKLIVINNTNEKRIIQLAFKNKTSLLYMRAGNKDDNNVITWNIWSPLYSLGENQQIPSGSDLNNIQELGTYFSFSSGDTSNMQNLPNGVTTAFKLIVEVITNRNDRIMQKIITNEINPKIFIRTYLGNWGNWYQIPLNQV